MRSSSVRSWGKIATVRAKTARVTAAQRLANRFIATGIEATGNQWKGSVTTCIKGVRTSGCNNQPAALATWRMFNWVTQWFKVTQ